MSHSPAEQRVSTQRQPWLLAAMFTVAIFALSQGMTLAMLSRVRNQVEDTNRRIQQLEQKLDECMKPLRQ